jgi:hypothetical protein
MKKLGYLLCLAIALIATPLCAQDAPRVDSLTLLKRTAAPPLTRCTGFGIKPSPAGTSLAMYFDGTNIKTSPNCITWTTLGGFSTTTTHLWNAPQTFNTNDDITALIAQGATGYDVSAPIATFNDSVTPAGLKVFGYGALNIRYESTRAYDYWALRIIGSGNPLFQVDGSGHQVSGGAAPTLSAACGVGSSLNAHSNDNVGRFTTAGTPTSNCTMTFATAWLDAPVCSLTRETGTAAVLPAVATAVTDVVFAPGAALATGATYSYQCRISGIIFF